MGIAFVFPGQGSQSVGMLGALAEAEPIVRETFAAASSVLGYDLWSLIAAGPAERLNETERTQPAMLAAGIATFRAWQTRGGALPNAVSGHSLGEFTALVAAGALDFGAAIELVQFRGRAMQEAVPLGSGAMAAVLGLEDADIEAACREAAQGAVVEPVNYNSPGQIVIAGESAAVARAIEAAKVRGAKRAVLLPVSVPSHSSLMRGAAERLRERLGGVAIAVPRIPYYSAVDSKRHDDPDGIRAILVTQLASPVHWTATVRALIADGMTTLAECGPGKVLTSLNRRIERAPGLTFHALEDPVSIDAARAAMQGE
ncbi:MAG TPA: ACP S-malonyltransferase [Steroidobacteraceae bacterium]|nr:ACP S-malonyltransferase [Steroidobacteraceae bacterium]HNS27148.1 ACP S-malonyltransferase [Steroidobacteraceae bacterium]